MREVRRSAYWYPLIKLQSRLSKPSDIIMISHALSTTTDNIGWHHRNEIFYFAHIIIKFSEKYAQIWHKMKIRWK